MKVTIELPEDVSAALKGRWDDVPRRSLLKEHHVPLRYTESDLDDDIRSHRELGLLPGR